LLYFYEQFKLFRKLVRLSLCIQGFKLFIGGLKPTTKSEALKEHFSQYGHLTDYVAIKKDKRGDGTKPGGFGYVTYERIEDRNSCLADCPHDIDGKTVSVFEVEMKRDHNVCFYFVTRWR